MAQRPSPSLFFRQDRIVQINNWFHFSEDDVWTPRDAIDSICNEFLKFIQIHKLTLCMSVERLRRSLYNAMCTIRWAAVSGTSRIYRQKPLAIRPDGWAEEPEAMWELVLEDLFALDTIDSFFDSIPVQSWEYDVPKWRLQLGLMLPDYIQPTFELLVEYGHLELNSEDSTYDSYDA
jgi:hypothetical protein